MNLNIEAGVRTLQNVSVSVFEILLLDFQRKLRKDRTLCSETDLKRMVYIVRYMAFRIPRPG
jgi:hypothetical protein